MSTIYDKIREIEEEMARTQKNKATSYHLGTLKAKLAKLRRELICPAGSGGTAKEGEGFNVKKSGIASVGLVGKPSVGKSSLLNELCQKETAVSEQEFTTLTCVPGNLHYRGCKIQILDLPGIIEGAKDGKGRGKQVIAVARDCDLLLMCLDASTTLEHKAIIDHELEGFGIRINKKPADIIFKKKERGGVNCLFTVENTYIDKEMVVNILKEYRISNADITFRCNATVDDLVDSIESHVKYIPALYVFNKIDKITIEEIDLLSRVPHSVFISVHKRWNFDYLLETMWEYLNLVRVYTKPKGQSPDYDEPVVLPAAHSTVENFCRKIHKTLLTSFKYALVWGKSVKHNPQKVGKDHVLADEDIVQIIKKV